MAELIVGVGLFLTVVSIAVGGFVRAVRNIRQTSELLAMNTSMGLVLEQIAREIRTGSDFCVNGQTCDSDKELVFKNAKLDTVTYQFTDGTIERGCAGICGGEPGTEAITAANVTIRDLSFGLFGNLPGDGYQPRVTVNASVAPEGKSVLAPVLIQTTVSARVPLDT